MRRLLFLCALALAPLAPVEVRADDDWGATRDPFDKNVIARYKATLARDPHNASALANLYRMYKQFRTAELLKSEYEKVLAKDPSNWAATVVLGHFHRKLNDDAKALEYFAKAVAVKDSDAASWLVLGEMHRAATKNKEALAAYDKALAHAKSKDMKKKSLRALADLALATGDTEAANRYFKQFLDLDPRNATLWIERGDTMLTAKKYDVALESYAQAEKLLASDPSRRIEVVARRGQAYEQMAKDDEAVAEYRRAIKLAPKGYYLEVELTGRIVDIYRKKQALPALLAQYEKEWPVGRRGHFEWSTLGKLYEETGQQDKAIDALRKAVAKASWELDTQRRLITLLENSGKDDEALAQYEAVVRAAPGEARFQLELADRYWRRGQEKKALETLKRLQSRFPADAGVISAIADLYQRFGKEDLAIAEYERLAKLEPEDPQHLVTLGEQYWQKNDKARAFATWKKLTLTGKAKGFATYAKVMQDHGQSDEALANYHKAIKLDEKNPEYYRGLAEVYEGKKQWVEALERHQKVLDLLGTKATDRLARRDARRKLVSILTRNLPTKEKTYLAQWKTQFADGKGELEAGYFLVEYWGKRNAKEQVAVLEVLRKRVPDDYDLTIDLVKAYRATRKYDEAVKILEDLAKAVPARERDVCQQIAEIKTEARRDEEAIEAAQKCLAKSPRDPSGYERLAERYVEMQRFAEAIEQYEKVLTLDNRNVKAQFALAHLYVQGGKPQRAAELLRGVMRTATDEEYIAKAARESIDLEEMTDSLGELEKVLAPLAFMMSHKPVYRRVLVDLYLRYVPRLVERERRGSDEVKQAARAELKRISGHGLQPLLEALRDEKDVGHQRIAIEVLGHLGNKGAAGPLVNLAKTTPSRDVRTIGTLAEQLDLGVRVHALVAAGRLGDSKVLVDVLPLMKHNDSGMREAATFALGRSADRRAVPALLEALAEDDRRIGVQTLACLGLGQFDDPRVAPAIIATLKDTRKSDTVRGACAYALGMRGAKLAPETSRKHAAAIPALLETITDNRGEAQRLAAWALGQIGDARALGPLIRAYFARAGRSADELVWAIGRVSGAGLAPMTATTVHDYPIRQEKYNASAAIDLLPGSLPRPPAPGKLVAEHADDIAKGLLEALAEHRDVVVSVLADLDGAPAELSLGALSPTGASDAKVKAALARIGDAIAPAIAQQLASDDPKVRALAVSVLAKLDGGKVQRAEAAITKALGDGADQVRASAMNSIAVLAQRRGSAPPALVTALGKTLGSGASWADRRVAALVLGKLGAGGDPAALVKAAGDASSFVREAVAMALAPTPPNVDTLLKLSRDDVPQVRAAAAVTLGKTADERAKKRHAELAKDPDPVVRQAIGGR